MIKPTIAVLDPYHPEALAKLKNNDEVEVLVRPDSSQEIIYERANAVMLRSDSRLTTSEFEKYSQLKYAVKQGVGVDNIDLDAAVKAGVEVYNTPGLNSEAVAELALSLALCLARRVCEVDRAIRDRRTVIRSQTLGRSLSRKVLGIAGMGNIGLAFAKKWFAAMEGTIIAYDPNHKGSSWSDIFGSRMRQVHDLGDLLKEADVVSLHVPLTKATTALISRREFAQMKQDAILLNCARGGVVDEAALLEALDSGKLLGAGLDAMEVEPPTQEVYGSLLSHENVILTPHIGASTVETQARSGVAVAELAVNLVLRNGGGNRVV
ncbi:hypothetical protein LTR64_005331 [Lithohypha guttulata]|uniref:uncharacterized protein n=1 Tax=Lithohypha guttulata TaxID=1690604 RepID=UPI002DE1737D|nr:hypothetical protein LTR51_002874 [Lithohypha guttulata]